MISVNWNTLDREIGALVGRFDKLPRHIGKKHLVASMRRAVKEAGGVQKLRAATPPANTRRGRRKNGEKRSTGALRRSVTTKARYIGNNGGGVAVAGLGYKYGNESRKAIWHEFGTTRMKGVAMMQKVFESIRGQVASKLAEQLRIGLERAANELSSDMNPGMSKRGMAAGL